jgi:hypothetical protein
LASSLSAKVSDETPRDVDHKSCFFGLEQVFVGMWAASR